MEKSYNEFKLFSDYSSEVVKVSISRYAEKTNPMVLAQITVLCFSPLSSVSLSFRARLWGRLVLLIHY